MNWFKHDSDASSDAKIKKLLIRYGAVGYAVYFHSIELIAGDISENNLTFQLEHDSEIIADNLKIKGTADKSGIEIVEEIMRYIVELGLFIESENRIFCTKLLKRLDTSMTSSPRFRSMITDAKESHDAVMTTSCKKRREEKRKEEITSSRFKKPTIDQVKEYCKERENRVDAERFWHHYESNGWVVGKNKIPMKNWKSAVITWEKNGFDNNRPLGNYDDMSTPTPTIFDRSIE